MIELGITTFGETTILEETNQSYSHPERIRQLVAEIELADQVGLDVYGIGEHHREDFAVSAPEIVLAAGAVRTNNIRLSSAVTILSSNDPIRVYQQFSTIDALSNGRAEIMAGRGSFIESFPLFGYDLADYDDLFNEKMNMLLAINSATNLDWKGHLTQTVNERPIYPRALQRQLPIWVATGGNVDSTIRIAEQGLPIVYATIGGNPKAFRQLVHIYKEVGSRNGHKPEQLKVAAHSWGWIEEDNQTAEQYLRSVGPEGAIFVGSPEVVAHKIIGLVEALELDRFMLHLPVGSMPHKDVLNAIKLYGKEVAPIVRKYFEKN
ncbi:TPA: LLM class flavin-dependent oxidoreductase [Streptococcus agalactiae]